MGVKFVREHTEDRDGEYNDRGERTYRRSFTVEMENATDGPELILPHPDIPQRFSSYIPASGEVDLGATCQVIRVSPKDRSRNIWTVIASYTTKTDPTQFDPLERPAEISYTGTSVSQPIIQDMHGNALINSAGDLFDPPPDDSEGRLLLKITVNIDLALWDAELDVSMNNTVNQAPFFVRGKIYKKRHVKFNRSSAVSKWENGFEFWQVTYEFELRPERIPPNSYLVLTGGSYAVDPPVINAVTSYAWTRFILDRGFRVLGAGGIRNIALDDKLAQPYSSAVLLNGAGQKLVTRDDPAIYLGYDYLQDADFTLFWNGQLFI